MKGGEKPECLWLFYRMIEDDVAEQPHISRKRDNAPLN